MLCVSLFFPEYMQNLVAFLENSKLLEYGRLAKRFTTSKFTFCEWIKNIQRSTGSCASCLRNWKHHGRRGKVNANWIKRLNLNETQIETWMISLRNWSFSSHRIIQMKDPILIFIQTRLCNYRGCHISAVATAGIRCRFTWKRGKVEASGVWNGIWELFQVLSNSKLLFIYDILGVIKKGGRQGLQKKTAMIFLFKTNRKDSDYQIHFL